MGVPDRESRKPKAAYKPEKIDTPVDMVFYAPGFTMHSFYIPATDENGKPIPSRNKDNSVKYLNGEPVYIEKLIKFDTAASGTKRNPELTLCTYSLKATDPRYFDKLKVLQAQCEDSAQPTMDQKQYDEHTNKVGAHYKYENITLQKQNADLKDAVKQMEAKIKELQAEKK